MKALFVHDHRFRRIGEVVYSPGGLPEAVLKRYQKAFGEVSVIGRIYDEYERKETYSPINDKQIRFVNFLHGGHNVVKTEVKKSDIVISRLPSLSGVYAIFFSWVYQVPCIVEVVGAAAAVAWKNSKRFSLKLLAPIIELLMKILIYNARYVIYVSRRFLQEEYPTKGKQIGCPDVDLAIPNENLLVKRLKRIVECKYIVLGLIGSLDVDYRGHKTLFLVGKELKKRGVNFEIRLLGGGSKERWVKYGKSLRIDGCVHFDGTLPAGQAVLEWIDNIDILVMPAKQETLGRAIIEAMSRGCPVVGSLETAIGEQIGSDCLANSDDVEGFTKIVMRMVEDKDYMKYCAQENFYRSCKYASVYSDKIRNAFFSLVRKEVEK